MTETPNSSSQATPSLCSFPVSSSCYLSVLQGGVSLPLLWILPHDALLLLVTCTRWWCGLGVFLLLQLQLGLGQAL